MEHNRRTILESHSADMAPERIAGAPFVLRLRAMLENAHLSQHIGWDDEGREVIFHARRLAAQMRTAPGGERFNSGAFTRMLQLHGFRRGYSLRRGASMPHSLLLDDQSSSTNDDSESFHGGFRAMRHHHFLRDDVSQQALITMSRPPSRSHSQRSQAAGEPADVETSVHQRTAKPASSTSPRLLLPPNLPTEVRAIIDQLVSAGVPAVLAPHQLQVSDEYTMTIVPVAVAASSLLSSGGDIGGLLHVRSTPHQEQAFDATSAWSYEGALRDGLFGSQ